MPVFFLFIALVAVKGSKLRMKSFSVNTTILNHLSTTEVVSVLENPHDEQVEASFTVLLPPDAFILGDTFRLIKGDVVERGYVLERKFAKDCFDKTDENSTASLVSRDGPHDYKISTKVEARSQVELRLTYQELLARRNGYYTSDTFLKIPYLPELLSFEYLIHEDYPITELTVPYKAEKMELSENDQRDYRITLHNPSYTPNQLLQNTVKYRIDESEKSTTGDFYLQDNYFAHLINPEHWTTDPVMKKRVVFVIDISGSMYGQLERVAVSFRNIITQLDENDMFSVIAFDNQVKVWERSLVYGTRKNLQRSKKWVNGLEVWGSTNLHGGLVAAMQMLDVVPFRSDESKMIFLLTDGQANNGVFTTPIDIRNDIKRRNSDMSILIHTIGYDMYDYSLLNGLSKDSNGVATNVNSERDVEGQLNEFFMSLRNLLLRDVQLTYEIIDSDGMRISRTSRNLYENYFEGEEIIVSGELELPDIFSEDDEVKFKIKMNATTSMDEKIEMEVIEKVPIQMNATSENFKIPVKKIYQNQYAQELVSNYLAEKDTDGEMERFWLNKAVTFSLFHQLVTPVTSLFVSSDPKMKQMLDTYRQNINNYFASGGSWVSMGAASSTFSNISGFVVFLVSVLFFV